MLTTITVCVQTHKIFNLIIQKVYLPISKYFWCTESYSSHVILLKRFLSLDAAKIVSCLKWSFGFLQKINVFVYFFCHFICQGVLFSDTEKLNSQTKYFRAIAIKTLLGGVSM